jgi:DNA modification methylase
MQFDINTVYSVDCLSAFEKMEDQSVDHVFTSPPYNRKRNDKYKFYDDTLVDYKKFLENVIDESLRVSKKYVFFNIQKNFYNKREVYELIGKYAKEMVELIIWNKSNPMPASGLNITNAYEFVFVLSKTQKTLKSNRTYTKNAFVTSAFTNNEYTNIHKAVMHPKAAEYIISNFTKENDVILDPFMGVGTTGIVCNGLNRYSIGFELNEEYQEIANKRMKEYQKT